MKMPYAGSLIRILVVLCTLGAVTTLFLRAHKNSVDRPEYTNNLEASNVTTKIKKTLGPVESQLQRGISFLMYKMQKQINYCLYPQYCEH